MAENQTTASRSALARLLDAIEAAPSFLFGADLSAARLAMSRTRVSESEIASHMRTLIDGARATPGFLFKADVDAAEQEIEIGR